MHVSVNKYIIPLSYDLFKRKTYKVNRYKLKSLGRSAVKLTNAGSPGMLLLCHNRDRQVSLVVFIAAVMVLSSLYSFGCYSVSPRP